MFNRIHNPDYYYAKKKTKAKKTEKKGASVWRVLSARCGTMSSLVNIFTASAIPWNSPNARNPKIGARLAPIRSWMSADCFRSTQVWNPARFNTVKRTKLAKASLMITSSITAQLHLFSLPFPNLDRSA